MPTLSPFSSWMSKRKAGIIYISSRYVFGLLRTFLRQSIWITHTHTNVYRNFKKKKGPLIVIKAGIHQICRENKHVQRQGASKVYRFSLKQKPDSALWNTLLYILSLRSWFPEGTHVSQHRLPSGTWILQLALCVTQATIELADNTTTALSYGNTLINLKQQQQPRT